MPRKPNARARQVASLQAKIREQSHADPTGFIARYHRFSSEHMKAGWHWLYQNTLDYMRTHSEDQTLKPQDRRNLAIALGIATEKALLLNGQPAQTVLNLHETRGDLGELVAKLMLVRSGVTAKVIEVPSEHR